MSHELIASMLEDGRKAEEECKELKSQLVALRERAERAEKEKDEAQTMLSAWQCAFATTQLDHAIAKRDALRGEVERLKNLLTCEYITNLTAAAREVVTKREKFWRAKEEEGLRSLPSVRRVQDAEREFNESVVALESALAAGEGEVDRKALIDMAQETMDALDDTVGEEN